MNTLYEVYEYLSSEGKEISVTEYEVLTGEIE